MLYRKQNTEIPTKVKKLSFSCEECKKNFRKIFTNVLMQFSNLGKFQHTFKITHDSYRYFDCVEKSK